MWGLLYLLLLSLVLVWTWVLVVHSVVCFGASLIGFYSGLIACLLGSCFALRFGSCYLVAIAGCLSCLWLLL